MKNTKKRSLKQRIVDVFLGIIIFAAAIAFVIKFAGPRLLRLYITSGVGNCTSIPILCMTPREKITDPPIDEVYRSQLLPYEFPKMSLSIPEGSLAVQERIQKIYYYKKTKRQQKGTLLYLLHEKPDYFVNLLEVKFAKASSRSLIL